MVLHGELTATKAKWLPDLIRVLGKVSAEEVDDVIEALEQLWPIAVDLGIEQEEIVQMTAVCANVTGTPVQVATQLRGAMTAFKAPTSDMHLLLTHSPFGSMSDTLAKIGLHRSVVFVGRTAKERGISLARLFKSLDAQMMTTALIGKIEHYESEIRNAAFPAA